MASNVRTSTLAIASLAFSILLSPYPVLTLVTFWVFYPAVTVAGVLLFALAGGVGVAALQDTKSSHGARRGKGLAIAGVAIGVAGTIIEIGQLVFWGLATNGYRSF